MTDDTGRPGEGAGDQKFREDETAKGAGKKGLQNIQRRRDEEGVLSHKDESVCRAGVAGTFLPDIISFCPSEQICRAEIAKGVSDQDAEQYLPDHLFPLSNLSR